MGHDSSSIILRGRDPITHDALTQQLRLLRSHAGAMGAAVVSVGEGGRVVIEALDMDRALLREGEEILVTEPRVLPERGSTLGSRPGRIESDLLTFSPLHGLALVPFESPQDQPLALLVFAARPLLVTDDALVLAARMLESFLIAASRFTEEIRYLKGTLTQSEFYSDRDPLTHALNRRGFISLLHRLEADWPHRRMAYAIIVADLDHLKQVNDRQGHAAGDALIQRFVETLRSNLREPENVGRLGGDEFAVVAKLRTPAETQVLLNRLRAALDDAHIAASLGAASRDVPMPLEELLVLADRAMYDDKFRRHEAIADTEATAPSLFEPTP